MESLKFLLIKLDLTIRGFISISEKKYINLKIWESVKTNNDELNIIELDGKYFEGVFKKEISQLKINRSLWTMKESDLPKEPTAEYIVEEFYIDNFYMNFNEKLFIKKIKINLENYDRRTFIDPTIRKRGDFYSVESKDENRVLIGEIYDKRDFIYIKNIDRSKDFIIVVDGVLSILKTRKLDKKETKLNIILNFDEKEDCEKEEKIIKQYIRNRLSFNGKVYLSLFQKRVENIDEYLILIAGKYRECKLKGNVLRIGRITKWNVGGRAIEKKVSILEINSENLNYIKEEDFYLNDDIDQFNKKIDELAHVLIIQFLTYKFILNYTIFQN